MSILPLIFDDFHVRPSRLLDQHFGLGLDEEDLLAPFTVPHGNRLMVRAPNASYYRPWRSALSKNDTGSTVSLQNDKFQVNLDVQQFAPEEISVKVTGKNAITVEGKHEERQDEHGYVSRHFLRRYVLPEGHDIDRIQSNLSSDGVLSISAPKVSQPDAKHRSIPITQTGQPSKTLNCEKKDEKAPAKNEKGKGDK